MARDTWTMTILLPDETTVAISELDMTAGEEELAWAVASATIPHVSWTGTNPVHCPGCLNGVAVAAICARSAQGGTFGDTAETRMMAAQVYVATRPRLEVLGWVGSTPPVEE